MYALLRTALFAATLHQVTASPTLVRRGDTPAYFADPSTTQYCSWWFDNESETDCKSVPGQFGASFEDFLRWVGCNDAILQSAQITHLSHRTPSSMQAAPTSTLTSPTVSKPTGNPQAHPPPSQQPLLPQQHPLSPAMELPRPCLPSLAW